MAGAPRTQIPAVVVGGTDNCGGLGIVRSLGRAGVPVIVIDREATAPALYSRYTRKVLMPELSGHLFVQNLLTLQAGLNSRPVLFLTSDEAALTVSEYRTELQRGYRLRLPEHDRLMSLMRKNDFQGLAIEHGFRVPRSVQIRSSHDLGNLSELTFPAVVKPSIKTEDYLTHEFERGYPVASLEQAESVIRRILPVLSDLIVQEWIEGPDSAIYFCLMYRDSNGPVSSFTGRKLSIWPPGIGTTASCASAPEAHDELHRLTEAFFAAVSFAGMGSMEYKRDARTGEFFMIEPTVGRVDWQEEVATLNGINIPLAAYLHEIGAEAPAAVASQPVVWRDRARHWKATRSGAVALPAARVCDAYWRLSDPLPALFHVITMFMRTLRRVLNSSADERSALNPTRIAQTSAAPMSGMNSQPMLSSPDSQRVRPPRRSRRLARTHGGGLPMISRTPRDIVRLGRNFLLSVSGEGMQSGIHFALNLVLIRILSPHDFGVFAIAFVLSGIALTYGNAMVSTPAAVLIARLKNTRAANFQDVMFGSITLVISASIAIIVAAGLWFATGQGAEAIAGGAFSGLWTLRNHVRNVMFARQAMAAATLSDFSYTITAVFSVGWVLFQLADFPHLTGVLLALTTANIVAIFVALRALGRRVRISLRRNVWRRYRAVWPDVSWLLVGTTTWAVQGQALMFLVAVMVGPAAYAPLAVGVVLFTPLRPAVSAFINVFRPNFGILLARGQLRRLRVTMYLVVVLIVLSCAAVGDAIWLGWPILDTYLFAGKFENAPMPLIVALSGIAAAIYFTYNVPLTLIHGAGEFRPVALATTFGATVGLTSVSILLAVTSAAWALAGFIAGEAVCGLYLWISAQRILRNDRC